MGRRKQREAPPPSLWVRSTSGTPAMLKRTSKTNDADEWLYRLDFGNIRGTTLWSITDLDSHGVAWLDDQPPDWELADWRE